MTLGELATMLNQSATRVRPALEVDLAKIGEVTETLARGYIGQEMPEWKPLAPATIAEKQRLGYTGQVSATDPLLRTGELRESIGVDLDVLGFVDVLELVVGSTEKVALWQEMGTSRMPPRPFLGLAMQNSLPYAAERLGATMLSLLSPRDRR